MPAIISLIILGVIQGITEFLPVSSSGHLVLSKSLLGFPSEGAFLEVALHAGTLVPILLFYRKRILELLGGLVKGSRDSWRLAAMLIVATIPAGIIHLMAGSFLDRAYQAPAVAAGALCVTGVMLLIPVRRRSQPETEISPAKALWIGAAQAAALMPGISRSGSTIMLARQLGVSPRKAAEFSFFMAIPVLSGAILLELPTLGAYARDGIPLAGLAVGMATAAIVGYLSLALLIRMLAKGKFWIFGLYCLAIGGTALLLILTQPVQRNRTSTPCSRSGERGYTAIPVSRSLGRQAVGTGRAMQRRGQRVRPRQASAGLAGAGGCFKRIEQEDTGAHDGNSDMSKDDHRRPTCLNSSTSTAVFASCIPSRSPRSCSSTRCASAAVF